MKSAFFAIIAMVSTIAPNGALAHGGHGHTHRAHPHVYVAPIPHRAPWAREKCHWHPKKGYWHCHKRRRGHGEKMRAHQPNFGIHFIVPIQ